jgi:hypothetical protein
MPGSENSEDEFRELARPDKSLQEFGIQQCYGLVYNLQSLDPEL